MPTMVEIVCPFCSCKKMKYKGHVNRANKIGAPVYCSKLCSALARKDNKSIEQKKSEKAEYDRVYREKNEAALKVKRHNWFMQDYAANPEKYRQFRKDKYQKHLEYLSTPEYKAWKKKYDRRYHSSKKYGEFGECAVLLEEIEQILVQHIPRHERYVDKNSYNKSQKRKRLCKKIKTNLPQ